MIKICNIILSYLEENQKYFFWLNDRLIIYRKKRKNFFQLSIQPQVFFGTSPVTSAENLKS